MSDILKAIVLGVIQGLTEFLPVSSSGHLELVRKLHGFGLFANAHLDKMFDVALHAGTLVALLIYFRSDLPKMLRDRVYQRLLLPILGATLVVLAIGKVLENKIEQHLNVALLVAIPLILFGIILWLADRRGRKIRDEAHVSRFDVMLMTFSQVIALIPGVSRSGITMTTGLARGMTREAAVRFSFLLSIPVIAAPPLYFALQLARHRETLPHDGMEMVLVGVVAAAISGYLAIGYLLRFVRSKSFTPFMIYRVLLGLSVLALVAMGILQR